MKKIKIKHNNKDYYLIVDDSDYDLVSGYKWHLLSSFGKKYARTYENKKYVYMHRMFFTNNLLNKKEIDHINGNTLDNRRANLRICSHKENLRNRNLSKNNKSGYTGVYWDKKRERFVAQLRFDGKKIVKRFSELERAVEEYKNLSLEYFGTFSKFYKENL